MRKKMGVEAALRRDTTDSSESIGSTGLSDKENIEVVNKKGAVNGEVKQTTPKKQDNNEEEDLSEQQQQEEESENMSNNCSSDNHNNSDDMAHHKLPVKGDKSCIDNSDDKSEDGDNNDESVDGRNSSDQHKSLDKTSENSPKGFQSTSNKHVENGADTDQDTSDQEGHHNDQHNHHQPRLKEFSHHPGLLGGLANHHSPRQDPYSFSNSDDDGCSPNSRLGPPPPHHFPPMGFSMPMPLIAAPKAKKPRKPRKPRSPKHPGLGGGLGGLPGMSDHHHSMLSSMQSLKEEDSRSDMEHGSPYDDDSDGKLVIAEHDDMDDDHSDIKPDELGMAAELIGLGKDGKKPRRKHNRFNGIPEDEVLKRLLPDLICPNLDILIIGINPGLYAAFKQHHYAGPGNHFWKCMFLSGLIPRPMNADNDRELLGLGIGFTNIVDRTTRASQELTRQEIEEGAEKLILKIREYKPRIAVFNGKGIYEVFSGQKEFVFGKQPDKIEGTDTYAWVMPNSSARCAQLPRAVDKVPFYSALKKFRDFLRGEAPDFNEADVTFPEVKLQNFTNKRIKDDDDLFGEESMEDLESRIDPETGKKRRGRPPKPRPDGTLPPPKRKRVDEFGNPIPKGSNPIDPVTGKKKRGRPKKCDLPPGASGMAGSSSGMISEPGSVGSSTQGGNGSSSGGGVSGLPNGGMMKHDYPPPPSREDDDCSESGDAPSSVSKTPTRLPPFSPNFRGMGSMQGDEEGNDPEGGINDGDRLRPSFDAGEDGSQGSSQHDHHHMADLSARLSGGGERMPQSPPPSAGMHHPGGGEYEHSQRTSQPDHHEEASHQSGDMDDYQQQQQQRPESARSLNHGGPPPQAACNFSNPTTPVDDVGSHGHQGYPSGYPTPPGSGFQVMKNESGHPHHTPQHQESPTYQQQHSFHAPYRTMQDTPPHQGGSSGGFDSPQPHGGRQLKQHTDPGDVSTKSLTGLESLVDQIPAIAENDSGVFSGSGGGSHPPTPRSVGPYSPGQFHGNGGSNYLNSGFSGGGYPSGGGGTPGPSSNTDNYPTDLSSTSTNYSGGSSGPSAVSVSHSPVTHSNFSVSSLAHSSVGHGRHLSSADASALDSAAAAAAAALGGHSSLSDAFSVSSLASTYASALTSEAELSKYAASNPYMSQSSMFSSSLIGASRAGISPAASNFMSAASAGMGGMAGMGMASMAGMYGMSSAAYSQYGSAAGAYSGSAAAQAFAAAASGAAAGSYPHPHHGLHMPNPSYPYPSPYPHQSPYSQSPYF